MRASKPSSILSPFPYPTSLSAPHARYLIPEAYCVPAPSDTRFNCPARSYSYSTFLLSGSVTRVSCPARL